MFKRARPRREKDCLAVTPTLTLSVTLTLTLTQCRVRGKRRVKVRTGKEASVVEALTSRTSRERNKERAYEKVGGKRVREARLTATVRGRDKG